MQLLIQIGKISGAGAVAVAVAFEYFNKQATQKNKLSLFWFIAWLLLLAYLALSGWLIIQFGEEDSLETAFSILLFLGILPLFNAPLDWLSLGFTRGLLRSIAAPDHGWKRAVVYAFLDLLLAVVFLVLVALSSLLGLMLVNWIAVAAGGKEVIALTTLWKQLNTGGWKENLWIWLLLGSTLIPTAIHFLVALFALITIFPSRRANVVARQLQKSREVYEELARKGEADEGVLQAQGGIQVNEDARRFAWGYIITRKLMVYSLWGLGVLILGYGVFTVGTHSIEAIPNFFQQLMT